MFHYITEPVAHGPYWKLDLFDMPYVQGVKYKKLVISSFHNRSIVEVICYKLLFVPPISVYLLLKKNTTLIVCTLYKQSIMI